MQAVADSHPQLVINDLDTPINLTPYLHYLEDPSRQITYEKLASTPNTKPNTTSNWQTVKEDSFVGDKFQARYWFKFTISKEGDFEDYDEVLFLKSHGALVRKLKIWIPQNDGSIEAITTGAAYPIKQRDVDSHYYAFELPTKLQQYTIIGWIDQENGAIPALLPFTILNTDDFLDQSDKATDILTAFYAILFSLLLYNGCLFASIRKALYGYYLVFLLSAISLSALLDGSWAKYIIDIQPEVESNLPAACNIVLLFFYQLFIYEALNRIYFSAILKKCHHALFGLGILLFITHPLYQNLSFSDILSQVYSCLIMPLVLSSIFLAMKEKVLSATYLLLAELCSIAGVISYMLTIQGVIPINETTIWSLHAGFLGQSLMLSLALADRTNQAIKAQLKAQQLALINERKAHEAMEIATKAKNEFLASVSHELRTPLTSIIGFMDNIIERQWVLNSGVGQADTVLKAGKQLLGTIDDVLNLSLIDNQQVSIAFKDVETKSLIEKIETKYKSQATDKGVYYEVLCDSTLPSHLQIDYEHVSQILHQLINNAIKFTQQGKITISISSDQPNKKLIFTIIDSGIGISSEELEYLFEPFSQGDNSDSREYGGTGVGMFIAKSFTDLLQGTLEVESTEGVGSRFQLVIPYQEISTDKTSESAVNSTKSQSSSIPQLSGTVLYAEDNEDNQDLVKVFVEATGATLELAPNGLEAVNKVNARTSPYELILMDIQMPVMDGVAATQQLKKSGVKIPIVAFSASAMKSSAYEDCGFDGFISKPVDKKKLYATLSLYLPPPGQHTDTNEAETNTEGQKTLPQGQPPNLTTDQSTQEKTMNSSNWDFSGRNDLLEDEDMAPLLEQFENRLVTNLAVYKEQVEQENWEELKGLLHQLKGSAGGYGHSQLTGLAKDAESALKEDNIDAFRDHYANIVSYIEALVSFKA